VKAVVRLDAVRKVDAKLLYGRVKTMHRRLDITGNIDRTVMKNYCRVGVASRCVGG